MENCHRNLLKEQGTLAVPLGTPFRGAGCLLPLIPLKPQNKQFFLTKSGRWHFPGVLLAAKWLVATWQCPELNRLHLVPEMFCWCFERAWYCICHEQPCLCSCVITLDKESFGIGFFCGVFLLACFSDFKVFAGKYAGIKMAEGTTGKSYQWWDLKGKFILFTDLQHCLGRVYHVPEHPCASCTISPTSHPCHANII